MRVDFQWCAIYYFTSHFGLCMSRTCKCTNRPDIVHFRLLCLSLSKSSFSFICSIFPLNLTCECLFLKEIFQRKTTWFVTLHSTDFIQVVEYCSRCRGGCRWSCGSGTVFHFQVGTNWCICQLVKQTIFSLLELCSSLSNWEILFFEISLQYVLFLMWNAWWNVKQNGKKGFWRFETAQFEIRIYVTHDLSW